MSPMPGSLLFGLFLVGWGLSFIWGPIADRYGRTRTLAGTVLIYSVFTGAAALAGNVYELAAFRFLAGIGIGGEWAMAGTYVAEAWPEDRRRQGAGYLQTGYYAGFFVAAVLNFTDRRGLWLACDVFMRPGPRHRLDRRPCCASANRSAGPRRMLGAPTPFAARPHFVGPAAPPHRW